MITKNSDFIEGIRFEGAQRQLDKPSEGRNSEEPREDAAKLIVNAEQFKADVVPPQGKQQQALGVESNQNRYFLGVNQVNSSMDENVRMVLDDDEFFHVTCHVDRAMASKIGRGEYVDLEKLLVKEWFKRRDSEDRFEFVTREGHTYLAPAQDREPKINGIRRWEQAFQMYAAIYSKVNPSHAAEIWQYVHTINTAASNFVWENVAYYDYIFWQMMGQNPYWSWAKT